LQYGHISAPDHFKEHEDGENCHDELRCAVQKIDLFNILVFFDLHIFTSLGFKINLLEQEDTLCYFNKYEYIK
jgi:hypothetical protein